MSGLRADLRVLQKLLSEEIPELAEHLDLQGEIRGDGREKGTKKGFRSIGPIFVFLRGELFKVQTLRTPCFFGIWELLFNFYV